MTLWSVGLAAVLIGVVWYANEPRAAAEGEPDPAAAAVMQALDALESAREPEAQALALAGVIALGEPACNRAYDTIRQLIGSRDDVVAQLALQALGYCSEHREERAVEGLLDRAIRGGRRQPRLAAQAVQARARLGMDRIAALARPALRNVTRDWQARLLLADALERSRELDAVDVLIDMLDGEALMRVRDEIRLALFSLTRQTFPAESYVWRSWWRTNREGFVVPPRSNLSRPEPPAEGSSSTFFGIDVRTNRVVFVLDISSSMNAPARYVPDGMPPRDDGEPPTRIDVAKYELIRAIETVVATERNAPGERSSSTRVPPGVFTVIYFDRNVEAWRDSLQPATPTVLEEVRRHIREKELGGGTNIFDALNAALDVPGIDTVFFLSDGAPTVGVTDEDEIRRRIRHRNLTSRIAINTVSIGIRSSFMRDLAAENDGRNTER